MPNAARMYFYIPPGVPPECPHLAPIYHPWKQNGRRNIGTRGDGMGWDGIVGKLADFRKSEVWDYLFISVPKEVVILITSRRIALKNR